MEITGIPIYAGSRRVGTGFTNQESLTILWDKEASDTFKDLAEVGLILGLRIEPVALPGYPSSELPKQL